MGRDGSQAELKSEAADEASFLKEVIRLSGEYPEHTVCGEMYFENYAYALLKEQDTGKCKEYTYYNDFDDYEDDIVIGSNRWLDMFRQ